MLDYAVTLEFDRASHEKLQALIDQVSAATGCDHMPRMGIPPHVTVSAFRSEREAELISAMDDLAATMHRSELTLANIGVFNPLVIYVGPVVNEFLMSTCREVNARMLPLGEVGNRGRYLPWQWVPHVGIAVKMDPQALRVGFDILQREFTACTATVERIVLARAEPYEPLKSWELL